MITFNMAALYLSRQLYLARLNKFEPGYGTERECGPHAVVPLTEPSPRST
jgi:hypothetical protein